MNLQPTPQTVPVHPARGFAQSFGLHPLVALLTLGVDSMLFTGELASMGAGVVLSLPVSGVVGFLTFLAQQKFYGDDKDAAAIKGGTLALLTAIPTSLPLFLYLPAGVLGLFRRKS